MDFVVFCLRPNLARLSAISSTSLPNLIHFSKIVFDNSSCKMTAAKKCFSLCPRRFEQGPARTSESRICVNQLAYGKIHCY